MLQRLPSFPLTSIRLDRHGHTHTDWHTHPKAHRNSQYRTTFRSCRKPARDKGGDGSSLFPEEREIGGARSHTRRKLGFRSWLIWGSFKFRAVEDRNGAIKIWFGIRTSTHTFTHTLAHTHTRARSAKVHSVEMAKNSRTGTSSVSTLGGGYKINEKKGCFHGRTEPNRAVGSGCIVTGRLTTVPYFDNCSIRGEECQSNVLVAVLDRHLPFRNVSGIFS